MRDMIDKEKLTVDQTLINMITLIVSTMDVRASRLKMDDDLDSVPNNVVSNFSTQPINEVSLLVCILLFLLRFRKANCRKPRTRVHITITASRVLT